MQASQQTTAPIPPLPAQPGAGTGGDPIPEALQNGVTGIENTTPIVYQPYPGPPIREIGEVMIPVVGVFMALLAIMVIGLPIARAFARAVDRRSSSYQIKQTDPSPQIRQLQDSIDAMAIEIERISESQRFSTKLLSERLERSTSDEGS